MTDLWSFEQAEFVAFSALSGHRESCPQCCSVRLCEDGVYLRRKHVAASNALEAAALDVSPEEKINRAAFFIGQDDESELPCVAIDGVLVFVYVVDGALTITLDKNDLDYGRDVNFSITRG